MTDDAPVTDDAPMLPADLMSTGLNRTLDFGLDEAGPDRVVMSYTVGERHLQPYGIVHGGVHCSIVEAAASIGGALWFGDRGRVVGVSNHTDFLRAAREGHLVATAAPIHRGRTQQLWLVEIRDAEDRMIARGEVRLQNLPA